MFLEIFQSYKMFFISYSVSIQVYYKICDQIQWWPLPPHSHFTSCWSGNIKLWKPWHYTGKVLLKIICINNKIRNTATHIIYEVSTALCTQLCAMWIYSGITGWWHCCLHFHSWSKYVMMLHIMNTDCKEGPWEVERR